MEEKHQAPEGTYRPYAPVANVITVIQRLRRRNLPERIDDDYLRDAGIPEGSIARVLLALRFIHLLDGDAPTPALRSIAQSPEEEYKAILSGLVKEAYSDVFQTLDPSEDTQDRFVNFFRRYTPASQRERMVLLLLGLCKEAGMPTKDAPRQRGGGESHSKASTQAPAPRISQRRVAPTAVEPTQTSPTRIAAAPKALDVLISSLPPEGAYFPQSRQKQWLELARAALSFVYSDDPGEEDSAEEETADA